MFMRQLKAIWEISVKRRREEKGEEQQEEEAGQPGSESR